MSFKVSELLNPAPSSGPPSPKPHPLELSHQQHRYSSHDNAPISSHSRHSSYGDHAKETSDHDAANALADLATGGPVPVSPLNKVNLHSPTRQNHHGSYSHSPPRPTSSYSLAAVPVEPSPPLERAQQPFSPSLDQYHHSSRSSDRQRRQSWVSGRSSPPPRLAPIQSHPEMHVEQQVLDPADRKPIATATSGSPLRSDRMEDVQPTESGLEAKDVRSALLTEPIRHLSPNLLPVAQEAKLLVASPPPPQVKAEPTATPGNSVPQTPVPVALSKGDTPTDATSMAKETEPPKHITELKHEDSTLNASLEALTPPKAVPATVAAKKRAAPKAGSKPEKKGTPNVNKKPAVKKRRLGSESFDITPSSRRSATPASRASKTPAPHNRKQTSATPASSSPAPSNTVEGVFDEDDDMGEVDADYEEGTELFCICRKPDNHTWMIGCDGGCEDWFHGKCVQIKEEDGDLIDKYICPNCEKDQKGHTTWKPMCRLPGCRKPARVSTREPSKYCSDEHGREFMRLHSHKHRNKANGQEDGLAKKKRRKENYTDHDGNGDVGDEEMEESRGGVLRGGELKAVVEGVTDVKDFRTVGDQVLHFTPIDGNGKLDEDATGDVQADLTYTAEEESRLAEISGKKEALRTKRMILEDKELFLGMVKERAKEVKETEGVKDLCGYDSRLTWSDEEFSRWRSSAEGKKVFESRVLVPGNFNSTLPADIDPDMANETKGEGKEAVTQGICTKKRCERHKQWLKIQQQELAFEKDVLRQEMRKLDNEEKELQQSAVLRGVEQGQELESDIVQSGS